MNDLTSSHSPLEDLHRQLEANAPASGLRLLDSQVTVTEGGIPVSVVTFEESSTDWRVKILTAMVEPDIGVTFRASFYYYREADKALIDYLISTFEVAE